MNGRHQPTSQASPEARPEEPWTVGRLLTWTTDYLKRHGSESPRLDAEVMLAHVLEWQRVQLYTHFDDEVGQRSRSAIPRPGSPPLRGHAGRLPRRSQGVLFAAFEVSPAVLIPRPESEFVVVEFLALTRHLASPRAVDVGTGSGCLAIASAHRQPRARFVAIDISEEALAVARRNAAQLGVADRIDFRLGDQLEPVAGEGPFDAIISNPPYIPSEAIEHLEPGVRDYEPEWPSTAARTASRWLPG